LIFGVPAGAIEHDPGGAKFLAAVYHRHLAAEAREEVGFLHGRIASAYHHDRLAAVEEAVAGGARAYAVADELLLGRQAQPARRCAGGHNHGSRFDPLAFDVEAERARREIRLKHGPGHVLGAEALRLPLHVLDQFRPVDSLWKAREVLDQRGE